MILVKVKNGVTSVCDKELFNKVLNNGALKFKIGEPFFGGEEVSAKKSFEKFLINGRNINLVGNKAIEWAKDLGFLKEENIKYIEDVPHAIIIEIDRERW